MSTENKPSEVAMRAAEKIHPQYSKEWFSGIDPNAFLIRSYTTMHNEANKERCRLAEIIDAELASDSLEQRARAAAIDVDFYNGIEWFACWLLDHREGETITEEQLRPWAVEAWKLHLDKGGETA